MKNSINYAEMTAQEAYQTMSDAERVELIQKAVTKAAGRTAARIENPEKIWKMMTDDREDIEHAAFLRLLTMLDAGKTAGRDGEELNIFQLAARVANAAISKAWRDPIKGIPEVLPFLNFENLVSSRKGTRRDLDTPDVGELRKEISRQRALKMDPLWNFGEGLPTVNAAFLRDMLDILPDAKLCIYGSANSGVWFESPAGDGILLPVRVRRA